MVAELTKSRRSYSAWTTISGWSLAFNLALSAILALVGGWLGLFLTGPLMLLATLCGLAGLILAKDSYFAGRTQGAIFGVVWNSVLTLWPLLALVGWMVLD